MVWACIAASGMGSLNSNNDVPHDDEVQQNELRRLQKDSVCQLTKYYIQSNYTNLTEKTDYQHNKEKCERFQTGQVNLQT